MINRYVNRAKISEVKFRELIRFFSLDLTATQIAELTGLNRNTVNRYLTEIRKKIIRYCEITSPLPVNNAQVSETKGHKSFSILIKEHGSKIYTGITLPKQQIDNKTGVENLYDMISNFDMLIDMDSGKHHYLGEKNSDNDQHRRKVNRIESFWGNAKSRLAKFKGMHSSTFKYHLKECEFRYNNRDQDLYQQLLKILRKDPLF